MSGMSNVRRNPNCSCGCGREVSRPWNKFVVGHSHAKKLSDEDVYQIKECLAYGFSTHEIGRMYGVSNSHIWGISKGFRVGSQHVSWNTAETIRGDVIAIKDAMWGVRKILRAIRKESNAKR